MIRKKDGAGPNTDPAPKKTSVTAKRLGPGQRSAADREHRARALARARVHEYRDRPGPEPVGGSPSAGWLDRRAMAARRLPPLPPLVPEPRGPGWLARVDPWLRPAPPRCPCSGCRYGRCLPDEVA